MPWGALCFGIYERAGYIVPEKNIKELGYNELTAATNDDLARAFNLRHAQLTAHPHVPVYEINPITTVDRLILKLLKEPFDLVFTYSQPVVIRHRSFRFEVKGIQLRLSIKNEDKAGFIFHPGHFILLDVIGNSRSIFERFTVDPKSTMNKRLNLGDIEGFTLCKSCHQRGHNKFKVPILII